jgi:hypothetical protein
MSSPAFDPRLSLGRLLPIAGYGQSVPRAIAAGDKPDLGDLLGNLLAGQYEMADILMGLIHDIYSNDEE